MKGEAVRTKVVEIDTFEKFKDLTTEQKVEFIFAKKLGGEKK
jgi:hypothetical protein